jgi:hypothetical protein
MSGASYDCVYQADANAITVIKNCEVEGYGRLGVAVVDGLGIYVDGLTGSSAEATQTGLIDVEPNTGLGCDIISLSNITGADAILIQWGKGSLRPYKVCTLTNCQASLLAVLNYEYDCPPVQLYGCNFDTYSYPLKTTRSVFTQQVFINNEVSGDNLLKLSNQPKEGVFWTDSGAPTYIDDYVRLAPYAQGSSAVALFTSDYISIAGDFVSFGGFFKMVAAASPVRQNMAVEWFDSSNVSLGIHYMTINTTVTGEFVKQAMLCDKPATAVKCKVSINNDSTTQINDFYVKNVWLYDGQQSTDYYPSSDVVYRVMAAAPTTGSHEVGEIVYNIAPTAGGNIGWVCTTAGTPGTWKTFGAIAA